MASSPAQAAVLWPPDPGRAHVRAASLAAAGSAWVATLAIALTGNAERLGHDHLIEGHVPNQVAIPVFTAGWLVMILAMMFPAELLSGSIATLESQGRRAYLIVAGYLAAWLVFGFVAFDLDHGVHATVDRVHWLTVRPWLIKGGVFLMAGAFQLTRFKSTCLRLDTGLGGGRRWPNGRAAARGGFGQGVRSIKSCWALMLVAMAAGMTSLLWMVLLTAAMVAERALRPVRGVPAAIGAALVGTGVGILLVR